MIGNVSLMLARNELIGLVGPSEIGKTTLLRTISRLCSLRAAFHFDGVDRDSLIPEYLFSRELVQVSEGQQRFDKMTDEEALLVDALHQRDRIEMLRALERVYELLPVPTDRCRQFAGNLSGGGPQVCAMTRQRMPAPRLLTVSEVSHVLAPAVAHQLLGVLSEIRKQGVAVLLLEQDTFAAFSVAEATRRMRDPCITKERLARFRTKRMRPGHLPRQGTVLRTAPIRTARVDSDVRSGRHGHSSNGGLNLQAARGE